VKVLQRRMAVLGVMIVVGAPSVAAAQYGFRPARERGPDRDTPHLLVGTCHSSPTSLGISAAGALRDRIQSENNIRDLYVIPNKTVNEALKASGYAPDSALSQQDLGALGKIVHADEILDCDISLTPKGVREGGRLMLATDITQAQPLPYVEASDPGDAAKAMERNLTAARKQIDGNEKCKNDLRAGKAQDAVAAAEDAIKQYPNATLARLCLATAYRDFLHYPPDSTLAVTREIVRIDPQNTFALGMAVGAFNQKGEQDSVVATLVQMYKINPQDQSLASRIIDAYASSDDTTQAAKALPFLDNALKQNPGDPNLLQQQWKLLAKLGRFKEALAVGDQMVKIDTTLADSTYFQRQIGMAQVDSNWALVVTYAGQAEKKFPASAQFAFLDGLALRNTQQMQPAAAAFRRAMVANPKDTTAQLFLAQTFQDLHETDSVVAIANSAIAAGRSKDTWGPMLIAPAQDAFTAAQSDTAHALEHFQQAYQYAMHADSLAPSKYTKFFAAVSAFQIGTDAYRKAAAAQKEPATACPLAKQADDLFTTTQLFLPEGGSVSPETASRILQYLPQLSDATGKMVKAFCKK
jgi:tetratricopeptide (TPR) repeat protein